MRSDSKADYSCPESARNIFALSLLGVKHKIVARSEVITRQACSVQLSDERA